MTPESTITAMLTHAQAALQSHRRAEYDAAKRALARAAERTLRPGYLRSTSWDQRYRDVRRIDAALAAYAAIARVSAPDPSPAWNEWVATLARNLKTFKNASKENSNV
jgi:hypothetical protein